MTLLDQYGGNRLAQPRPSPLLPPLPPSGHIPLDFSDLLSSQRHDASLLNGLFTENSLVLVGGQVLDDVFRVWNMGFPFPEARYVVLLFFPPSLPPSLPPSFLPSSSYFTSSELNSTSLLPPSLPPDRTP